MMTYIREYIAQSTHLGQWHLLKENLTATMRSTLDSTPCHEIEPPSWPQPQGWVSFRSFESLYGQMNLVWILLFLAFVSYCVVDVFHCSRQAQFSPLFLLIIVACVCLHFFMCSTLCVCACVYLGVVAVSWCLVSSSVAVFCETGSLDACPRGLPAAITDVCSCSWPFTGAQIQGQVLVLVRQVLSDWVVSSPMCSSWMTLCCMWFGTVRNKSMVLTYTCMFVSLGSSLDGIVVPDYTYTVHFSNSSREFHSTLWNCGSTSWPTSTTLISTVRHP